MTEQNKNSNKILLFFIIFLTSFSLGFYISQNIDLSGNKEKIETNNGFVDTFIKEKMLKKDLDLNLFWQVYSIVSQNYYSSDEIKEKDLQYGIIDGFVKSL